jgi:hypothetical protein
MTESMNSMGAGIDSSSQPIPCLNRDKIQRIV